MGCYKLSCFGNLSVSCNCKVVMKVIPILLLFVCRIAVLFELPVNGTGKMSGKSHCSKMIKLLFSSPYGLVDTCAFGCTILV